MHRVLLSRFGFSDLKFLNYGYVSLDPKCELLKLDESDELERYSVQLYNHTISGVNLKGKDILEVGSGRGGGASFITRYYKPNSYVGLDLSKKLIRLCKKNYSLPGLSFIYGNAENLSTLHKEIGLYAQEIRVHRETNIELKDGVLRWAGIMERIEENLPKKKNMHSHHPHRFKKGKI